MRNSGKSDGENVSNLIDTNCYVLRKDRLSIYYIVLNYIGCPNGDS